MLVVVGHLDYVAIGVRDTFVHDAKRAANLYFQVVLLR
jgi:hypothetical protein